MGNIDFDNGVMLRKINNITDAVIINSDYLDRDIDYINKHAINGIVISRNSSKGLKSLDFLMKTSAILKLEIMSSENLDIDKIQHLHNLRYLLLDCNYCGILDFTKLNSLEYFEGRHEKNTGSLFKSKSIKKAVITAVQSTDLEVFKDMTSLEFLDLRLSKVLSLDGLSHLRKLDGLRICNNRKLKTIDIRELSSINVLSLYSCSQLMSFSGFSYLSHLKTIQVQNCPRIESIKGLNECPNLEALALFDGTKVADGDVSILKRMKKTWLQEFKHYNVKKSDLNTLNSELAYL